MGFKSDWNEAAQSSSIKPEGDYECLIAKAGERTFKSGTTSLNITFVIRNDVDQKYKNGYIYYTLWKRKAPTNADLQVKGYSFSQVMTLGKAAGLSDGKDYDNLEQFCEELEKKSVRVTLEHKEYNGKTQEQVSWLNSTKFPEVKHVFKQSENPTVYAQSQQNYASAAVQNFTEIPSDEDLPF